ncbi:N-carbamoylputrescine amidase [Gossypium australe]|uniref:N-carbamoylputrescine amidase n=1 Tax=Gossypium australe TaxID=47621 RepID=A0A5B6UF18_9ROSI|nr:N-carbamoylputrescine amidase [Gossypium australe]
MVELLCCSVCLSFTLLGGCGLRIENRDKRNGEGKQASSCFSIAIRLHRRCAHQSRHCRKVFSYLCLTHTVCVCPEQLLKHMYEVNVLVRAAHAKGANIILIQELFEGYYFCQAQREDFFQRAKPYNDHPTVKRMQELAKELGVVLPVSFFEEANNAHYNSVAIIDADGTDLGLYRKSHIPDGPGYQEKFYFNPGDTGFKMPLITGFSDQICKDWSWLELPFLFLLDNSSLDIVKPAIFLQNVSSVT